jgi:D-3-phosphoglycerate dehydrogenase
LELLEKSGCEVIPNQYGRLYGQDELRSAVKDVEVVIANVEQWDEAMFAAAPRLKAIVRFGTGYDSVDLEAAKRHKVMIANTPGINASAVAEHVIALLLSMVRDIPRLDALTRQGAWSRSIFNELPGRTLGILGFGAVGRQLAGKVAGLGLRCLAYDKFPDSDAAGKLAVRLVSLDEALEKSDYLSVNLPSIPETRYIINDGNISRMRDGALLINTARGPLVDEDAVARALASGKLGGMAADVFETEPLPIDYKLFRFKNFICTPHVAGETRENYDKTGIATAEAVLAALAGKEPANRLA